MTEVDELAPVVLDEHGVLFATAVPVTFSFVRSTEPSPYFGPTYQQDIEPAGRYMIHGPPGAQPPRGWTRGEVTFTSPLVIAFNLGDGVSYDDTSWKARLYRIYKAKGIALSRKLRRAGFDGIVTVSKHHGEPSDTREIVDLTGIVHVM